MADAFQMKVTGDAAVVQRLLALPIKAQKAVEQSAVPQAGTVIAKAARRIAAMNREDDMSERPPTRKDGSLRLALHEAIVVAAAGRRTRRYGSTVYTAVGPDYRHVPHAHLVEFGTAQRTRNDTGTSTGAMRPNPYMRPAYDEAAEAAVAKMGQAILKAVMRQEAKLGR